MRLNQYVARATGLSRRVADKAIAQGNVTVNGLLPTSGQQISTGDEVAYSGKKLELKTTTTIMLNKPVGYVCSREGQGNKTIYELLPPALHRLKPIGRLDKNTSGLLLLTDDGPLANELTHPKYQKTKIYLVDLQRALTPHDKAQIEQGVMLEDGISKLQLMGRGKGWVVTMQEGRNRQIRRTFSALGYKIIKLHRTNFGNYQLGNLKVANYSVIC